MGPNTIGRRDREEVGTASANKTGWILAMEMLMPSGRVDLHLENIGRVGETSFTVDILTNGLAPPQATLIGRDGYPPVTEIFADPITVQEGIGYYNVIRFTLFFASAIPPTARSLAVSFFQEDATQFTFPWFGLNPKSAISGLRTSEKARKW